MLATTEVKYPFKEVPYVLGKWVKHGDSVATEDAKIRDICLVTLKTMTQIEIFGPFHNGIDS